MTFLYNTLHFIVINHNRHDNIMFVFLYYESSIRIPGEFVMS